MRTILHCDCNSFFASVEALDNPELKNIPMAVGGSEAERKGIILAKNEAAKKYGIVTAETIASARKKCPTLIVVPPRHERYEEISKKVNDIYKEYTEFVEPFGIDESWLDVTDVKELFGDGRTIANTLRRRIAEEIGITISVGVSFTKAFAKLGSDMKKPDATTVIMPEDVEKWVYSQNLNTLLFAGNKTCERFREYGIVTIGDLAKCDEHFVEKNFGKGGMMLQRYAKGCDGERVKSIYDSEEVKSVGNSYTFPHDLTKEDEIRAAFVKLGDIVSARMRDVKVKGRVVGIVIKDENLHTLTRQVSLSNPTNHGAELTKNAINLWRQTANKSVGIRMLGIWSTNLVPEGEGQLSLFDISNDKKSEKLDEAIDKIREKYGKNSVKYASAEEYDTKYSQETKETY